MTLKKIIKEVYAAFIEKARRNCQAEGSARVAVVVGNDLVKVGQTWTKAFADDGSISEAEAAEMNSVAGEFIDAHVPEVNGGFALRVVYNGFSVFGFGWKGLKFYLNQWFGLELK